MVAGERAAGAAEARLDLVGDEQHAAAVAELAGAAQVAVGRDDHAGLALDRLDQEGDGVVVERGLEGVQVAEGDALEAGGVGAEVSWAAGSLEKEMRVVVRPWKFPAQTTILARPGATPLAS